MGPYEGFQIPSSMNTPYNENTPKNLATESKHAGETMCRILRTVARKHQNQTWEWSSGETMCRILRTVARKLLGRPNGLRHPLNSKIRGPKSVRHPPIFGYGPSWKAKRLETPTQLQNPGPEKRETPTNFWLRPFLEGQTARDTHSTPKSGARKA